MGHGTYSSDTRHMRATSSGYYDKSAQEIFTQRNINNAMSPYNLGIRESRDSEEHPNSLAIIIALDVTGSMRTVPHFLVKDGLPNIMDAIIKKGIPDPQVLFLGVGDHECDRAPIQVSQFESSDELLDKWLTSLYLEGGGGGNFGESYQLAWYVAAKHTDIDSLAKRSQKGILFTIGDEPVLEDISGNSLKSIFGEGQYSNTNPSVEILEQASQMYDVFHINICETDSGARQLVQDSWKQLIGDHLIMAKRKEDVASFISNMIVKIDAAWIPTTSANAKRKKKSAQATSDEEML